MHFLRKFWKVELLFFLVHRILANNLSITTEVKNDSPITLNDEFFTPAIDFFDLNPEIHQLIVVGDVYNSLNSSLVDLKALPVTSEIVRLT